MFISCSAIREPQGDLRARPVCRSFVTRRKPLSRALVRDAPVELSVDDQRRQSVHERPRCDGQLFGIALPHPTGALPVVDGADEQTECMVARRLECGMGVLVANLRTETSRVG